ncbi:MAG: hypothetical protein ACJ76J_00010 [Thermoanaerobaculia bacterium]
MSSRSKQTPSPNAFRSRMLELLRERDEPGWVSGCEMQAHWKVVRMAQGWGVFRDGEDPEQGAAPKAVCASRGLARVIAATLPALHSGQRFRLLERSGGRFPLEQGGRLVGDLEVFDPELAAALHVQHYLAQTPHALAALLGAAGPTALALIGEILQRDLSDPAWWEGL